MEMIAIAALIICGVAIFISIWIYRESPKIRKNAENDPN